jgi:hypothetical protein
MWLKLNEIPGVRVKGIVEIGGDNRGGFDQTDLDQIFALGGQYLGSRKDNNFHYFGFDVVAGKGELAPHVKTKMSTLYRSDYYQTNMLFAQWNP